MYYIGLDVHKKTISYCVKDISGRIQQQGTIPATRTELNSWMNTLPQPWMVAMEATIFTGWVHDHLLPHTAQVKEAHPVMLRAIAASRRRTTGLMPARLQTVYVAISFRSATWFRHRFGIDAERCTTGISWF